MSLPSTAEKSLREAFFKAICENSHLDDCAYRHEDYNNEQLLLKKSSCGVLYYAIMTEQMDMSELCRRKAVKVAALSIEQYVKHNPHSIKIIPS